MSLTGPRKDAKSGQADSLVIFLHGYGADGNDLLGLGDVLADHLPNTTFLAPNAPDRCTNNPMGFQWFPIPRMDGSTMEMATQAQAVARGLLDEWLNEVAAVEGIKADRTIIVGFSQGTMMALDVIPRRAEEMAGVVGFSGRLLNPEKLEDEVVSKPPVMLIHGDIDEVVPPESLPAAADALTKTGFEVYTHISKGTGHGIAQDGLSLALQFILKQLVE